MFSVETKRALVVPVQAVAHGHVYLDMGRRIHPPLGLGHAKIVES